MRRLVWVVVFLVGCTRLPPPRPSLDDAFDPRTELVETARMLEHAPSDLDALLRHARAALTLGEADVAHDDTARALAELDLHDAVHDRAPITPALTNLAVDLSIGLQAYDRALAFARYLAERWAGDPRHHLRYALAALDQGLADEAMQAFAYGLRLFPHDPDLALAHAAALTRRGEVEAAIDAYLRAVDLPTLSPDARASAHDAIARLALTRAPDPVSLELAIEHARAAIDMAGADTPAYHITLISALRAAGQDERARRRLDAARRRFPDDPDLAGLLR